MYVHDVMCSRCLVKLHEAAQINVRNGCYVKEMTVKKSCKYMDRLSVCSSSC